MEDDVDISYVLVPSDTSKPLQELTFRPLNQQGVVGDLLLEHLKPAFKSMVQGKDVDVELLKKHATTTLASSSNLPGTVSDTTLQSVAAEANIEVFSLVRPNSTNQYTGINIYLDEGTKVKL
jgi:hypothetical protein